MSALRKAAELALDALDSKYIVNCGAWRVQRDQAIDALRAALAQPDEVAAAVKAEREGST